MRVPNFLMLMLAVLALSACGGKAPDDSGSSGDADQEDVHDHAKGPHGGAVVVASDHSAHFEILHDAGAMRVDLYVMDADLKPVAAADAPVLNLLGKGGSASIRAEGSSDHWTFTHDRLGGEPEGRFRIRIGGKTYQAAFEHAHDAHDEHEGHDHEDGDEHEDGDGHAHDDEHAHDDASHGPHDGVVAAFQGDPVANPGWIELKLHDDLGDLELWLAKDEAITQPFDLPVGATLKVLFHDHDGREVTLAVRNREKNEGEDGVANMRGSNTNYFIFPGETGADAKWLCGADFHSRVTVFFEHGSADFTTKVFELRPHTHGAHDDDHDEGHDGDEGHDKGHDEHEGHDHDEHK